MATRAAHTQLSALLAYALECIDTRKVSFRLLGDHVVGGNYDDTYHYFNAGSLLQTFCTYIYKASAVQLLAYFDICDSKSEYPMVVILILLFEFKSNPST